MIIMNGIKIKKKSDIRKAVKLLDTILGGEPCVVDLNLVESSRLRKKTKS
jgi:hypothetical protein